MGAPLVGQGFEFWLARKFSWKRLKGYLEPSTCLFQYTWREQDRKAKLDNENSVDFIDGTRCVWVIFAFFFNIHL